MFICYRLLDVDLLLRKLACGPDREHFRQWCRATLDAMSERRTELGCEPRWGRAKVVGDRQFVTRLLTSATPRISLSWLVPA
jgi:hypothetical protein